MAPSVRPDGRPSRSVCKNGSDTGRTAHIRAVGAQRGAVTPDVRPVAPTSIGWPIWPVFARARPCEGHATIAHVTATAVGVCWHHPRTEHLRLTPCHQWCRTCDSSTHYWDFFNRIGASWPSEPTRDAYYYHGTTQIDPVPLGASQIPKHKPSRRRVASV